MQINQTKRKLREGETVFGCFTRSSDPALIEFLCFQGWDFVVLDAEHGTLEPRDCENLVRVAELREVTPIIRATTNRPPILLRYLDTGAQGVHVPMVCTREDAEAAVRAVKFGPRGTRGLAASRAAGYGQRGNLAEYVRMANEETLVVAHIETAEAVEELPRILEVKDLDVVFIGPTDLSHSLGLPGDAGHPRVQEAIDRVFTATAGTDKVVGTLVPDAQAALKWKERGARYLAVSLEALLKEGCRNFLGTVR